MGSGPARKEGLKIKGWNVKKAAVPRFLNAHLTLPYHLRAGRCQCFGKTVPLGLHKDESPARWRAG
jgi:hypothetical protein